MGLVGGVAGFDRILSVSRLILHGDRRFSRKLLSGQEAILIQIGRLRGFLTRRLSERIPPFLNTAKSGFPNWETAMGFGLALVQAVSVFAGAEAAEELAAGGSMSGGDFHSDRVRRAGRHHHLDIR